MRHSYWCLSVSFLSAGVVRQSIEPVVSPDRFAYLFEGIPTFAIDTKKISDAIIRHIGQVGQASIDSTVVAVINETIFNAPEITETVSCFQTLFGGPSALGILHAIDLVGGDHQLSIRRAAIEIELQICRHVVGGRVDGPGWAHDDMRVRKGSLAARMIKRGRRTWCGLEVGRSLHPDGHYAQPTETDGAANRPVARQRVGLRWMV